MATTYENFLAIVYEIWAEGVSGNSLADEDEAAYARCMLEVAKGADYTDELYEQCFEGKPEGQA